MTRVFLGLGSNIDPELNLNKALALLRQAFQVVQVSPWYRSAAQGFVGPDFINLVVELNSDLGLAEFAKQIRALEYQCGRPENAQKLSSRGIDIDILLFGELAGRHEGIVLPRADLCRWAFVLRPLLDIAPNLQHPATGEPLANYWPALANQPLSLI